MSDEVNHPQHYASGEVECIEIARHMDFDTGNAFKYLWRHPTKHGGIVDLQKADWYIDDWRKNYLYGDMGVAPPHSVRTAFNRMQETQQFPADKIDALMSLFFGFWYGDIELIRNVQDYIISELQASQSAA